MSKQAVLEAALQLSADEREEIADRLYASLHPDNAEEKFEYAAEWTAEIERRLKEIREGRAKLVDGPTVLAHARAIVEGARRRG